MAEIEATREYDFDKDPAYQIGKDEKGYQIRVDPNGRWIAIKDTEVVHSKFFITEHNLFCKIPESNGGTTVLIRKTSEPKPLEEVLGTEIQIYNHPRIKERIGESLFYTHSETKKQEVLPFAAVLREFVDARIKDKNGKNPSMNQILGAVNELRDGTLEEQAIYGMFREHLIENDLMPVDGRGRPYDLSLYFIPSNFNMHAFFTDILTDRPELSRTVTRFYREKHQSKDSNQDHLHACLNALKTEMPSVFMEVHNYLVDNRYIPASPLLATLDLQDKKMNFLLKPALQDVMTPILNWVRENKKSIEEMRLGTLEEQGAYYQLCTLVKQIRERPEKPKEESSYPKEAESMFARAQAKRARATIETRL